MGSKSKGSKAAPLVGPAIAGPITEAPAQSRVNLDEILADDARGIWGRNEKGVRYRFSIRNLEARFKYLGQPLTGVDLAELHAVDDSVPAGTKCVVCERELSGRATRSLLVTVTGATATNRENAPLERGQAVTLQKKDDGSFVTGVACPAHLDRVRQAAGRDGKAAPAKSFWQAEELTSRLNAERAAKLAAQKAKEDQFAATYGRAEAAREAQQRRKNRNVGGNRTWEGRSSGRG